MMIVGLTGGIASGKSMISDYLKELGAVIIDADQIARDAVRPHEPAWQKIIASFGSQILDKDEIDRKKLGKIVFSSALAREKLNAIVHPVVINKTKELISYYQSKGAAPLLVVDAPLLIEAGMTGLVNEVWVVAVPKSMQIERMMKRDGLTEKEAQNRLQAQMPLEEKLKYADRVIDNSKTKEETHREIRELWDNVVVNYKK